MLKFILLGAGKVAWHLTQKLAAHGHEIIGIHSRSEENAQKLLATLPGKPHFFPTKKLSQLQVDVVLCCLPDEALQSLAGTLEVPENAHVWHTSGTKALSVFGRFPNAGVFYPLQTFSKEKQPDFDKIYFLLEGSNEKSRNCLAEVAQTISVPHQFMSSTERGHLHVAAVWACNFSNHMLAVAHQYLEQQGFDFKMLHPLIEETFQKALSLPPQEAQTGPALRGDEAVLAKHIALLQAAQMEDEAALYQKISQQIQNYQLKK